MLTDEAASFDRRDVLRGIAERSRSGAPIEALEVQAGQFLASGQVLRLAEDRYTTPAMLRLEAAMLTNAERRLEAGVGVVTYRIREAALARTTLSEQQREMVERLTTSGQGVEVVVGVAGAGKTASLAAAHAAWAASSQRTIGAALAARAASELEHRTGIPAATLDALLRELDQPGYHLPPRSVVVLDEAGMVGTRKLARLLAHADTANAKVVLVGDTHQLPEIEAGGAFGALAHRLPAVTLTENHRQRDPIERRALAELRAGNAATALQRLDAHGRITRTTSIDDARQRMVQDWLAARSRGQDALMLAARRVDVEKLNNLAPCQLLAAGTIEAPRITIGGRAFAVGDQVMTLSNRPHLGLVNGARGTVTATHPDTVEVHFDRGTDATLPSSYLQAGHLTHAYAMTVHKAQGLTCDCALILASGGLSREAGYTALSRGRLENRIYAPVPELPNVDVGHRIRGAQGDAMARLASALESSRRKDLALDAQTALLPARSVAGALPALGLGLQR